MDKFGIFNLLSSLLNNQNTPTNEESNQNTDNSSPVNFLNALTSSLKTQQKEPSTQQTIPPRAKAVPLQSSMLSTMTSHDKFINRVKEKNSKHHTN